MRNKRLLIPVNTIQKRVKASISLFYFEIQMISFCMSLVDMICSLLSFSFFETIFFIFRLFTVKNDLPRSRSPLQPRGDCGKGAVHHEGPINRRG